MSSETDRLGERVANIEGQITHINERLGSIESRIDRLDDKIDREINQLRTDIRRWLVFVVLATSLAVAIITVFVQVAL